MNFGFVFSVDGNIIGCSLNLIALLFLSGNDGFVGVKSGNRLPFFRKEKRIEN